MRISRLEIIVSAIFILNIFTVIYFLKSQSIEKDISLKENGRFSELGYPKARKITFLLREFEEFQNLVSFTANDLAKMFPRERVLVVADKLPYPPVVLSSSVKLVTLQNEIDKTLKASRPEAYILSEYVVVIPDGTVVESDSMVHKLVSEFETVIGYNPTIKALIAGINENVFHPVNIDTDLKTWSAHYTICHSKLCNGAFGSYVLVMKTENFFDLFDPFVKPLPYSLSIQFSIRKWTMFISKLRFDTRLKQFKDAHLQWKHLNNEKDSLVNLYETFGIKKVVNMNNETEWYGCDKETSRCFGSIIDDMPEYIYRGRWTPPCCLKALRETGQYVFSVLEKQGVRYWLEGGSLLGAARGGDIIPWDYDIDLGAYKSDIEQCDFIRKTQQGPFTDEYGYVWEKANPSEGDFYRVQYSQSNHLHIDIFPFFPKNGIMTKKTWFKSHKQDREFPERFLEPLTKIRFIGTLVSAPNNVKEFLEFKFGKGVIENPQYPNPNKKRFMT